MMRYAITLAYNGANYHGWQKQENANSVQSELDMALSTLLRSTIETLGCGRTDTGVHARHFVAHFDYDQELPTNLAFKLNALLPKDISIFKIQQVADTFHARFDATKRKYTYHIHFSKDPFIHTMSWLRPADLDFGAMNEACKQLLGTKDFQCFCKGSTLNEKYECTIYEAGWQNQKDKAVFTITANRFLRNMVRAIVGTLMEIGTGKRTMQDLQDIIQSKNRSDAGNSVPAFALFLEEIEYPETALPAQ